MRRKLFAKNLLFTAFFISASCVSTSQAASNEELEERIIQLEQQLKKVTEKQKNVFRH